METKLWTGNIPYAWRSEDLRKLFAANNVDIVDAEVTEREGKSAGHGIVTINDIDLPVATLLDGKKIGGLSLKVKIWEDRKKCAL